jgi:hypothetical protein
MKIISGYTPDEVKLYSGVDGVAVQSKPIVKGTFAKGNSWQYMFLCQNCLANSTIAFDQSEDAIQLAYVVVSSRTASFRMIVAEYKKMLQFSGSSTDHPYRALSLLLSITMELHWLSMLPLRFYISIRISKQLNRKNLMNGRS